MTRYRIALIVIAVVLLAAGITFYSLSSVTTIEEDIPFWFYRMKGPALEFVLDAEQAGDGRILVWVE